MIAARPDWRRGDVVGAVAMLFVRDVIAMKRVLDMFGRGPARLAVEGQEDQPPRIETGQQRGERAEEEGDAAVDGAAGVGALEDRVLRPVAGETDRRRCRRR